MTRDLGEVKVSVLGVGAEDQPKLTQAEQLIRLAEDARHDLFHTPGGQAYARVPVQGHWEVHRIRRRVGYRQHLLGMYFDEHERPPNSQAMEDALGVLEARALHRGRTQEVFVRVAPHPTEAGVVIDLGDEAWRQIVVTSGSWHVTREPLVAFRRPLTALPLPEPRRDGSLDLLRDIVNVPDDSWVLIVGFLIGALLPLGPFPILLLIAQQGSGKSFLATVLKNLLDPASAPLRAAPRDERDLLIGARNSWIPCFDNLSTISDALSDALCRLSTGGGLSTRELYSDDAETVLEAKRPTILTGIEDLATRGDLLDRSLPVELPRIEDGERRTEADLLQRFEQARPLVLGALLDAVVTGLRRRPTITVTNLPRLADFALWAIACEPATGLPDGAIATALGDVAKRGAHTALEADPLAGALQEFLEREGAFTGRASELLAELDAEASDSARRARTWPKAPNALAGRLRRLAPSLPEIGVNVASKRAQGITTWIVDRVERPAAKTATIATGPQNVRGARECDGSDGTDHAHRDKHPAAPPRTRSQPRIIATGSAGSDGSDSPAPLTLGDRAARTVGELRFLGVDDLRQRWRDLIVKIDGRLDVPTLITIAAETQPVQVTATLEMVTADLLAGVRIRPWPEYLAAARAAFDGQRQAAA
jgi:hypothetical protein